MELAVNFYENVIMNALMVLTFVILVLAFLYLVYGGEKASQ